MENKVKEVKDFLNPATAELFEEVALDNKVLGDFLAYFKKMSKHTKDLTIALDTYFDEIGEDFEAQFADGKIPSEGLIPPLLTEQFVLVQKLILACAKFNNQ